jgi:hypothetical protein
VQVLQLGPKIPVGQGKYRCRYCNEAPKFPVGKGKYECKYYNETPKFQLVEISINPSIFSLNE